jgi:4-hydroxybenzoate polyprenyltransferase
LFGGGLYFCVLIGAAALESAALRGVVAGSVAITLAYTPVLKRLPLVKNAAVAAVIALAPAAGALAAACAGPGAAGALGAAARAGGGAATTPTLLLPPAVARTVAFVFCAIVGREVLMDVGDVAGDAAAGVATLPVVAGARAGLVASALALAAAASLLVGGIVNAQGAARAAQAAAAVGVAPALGAAAVALAAALACAALVSPPLRALFGGPAGRTRAALGPGIDGLLAPVGAGCLLLAGLA